jgi:hypothetical protein
MFIQVTYAAFKNKEASIGFKGISDVPRLQGMSVFGA